MERTTVFSAVFVINIFSIADPANHNNRARHVKQDPIIAHSQPIHRFGLMQALEVAMQTLSQSFDLAKNLGALTGRQTVEVIQCRRAVFDRVTMTVHRVAIPSRLLVAQEEPWCEASVAPASI